MTRNTIITAAVAAVLAISAAGCGTNTTRTVTGDLTTATTTAPVNWPSTAETAYLNGCEASASTSACQCTLTSLESSGVAFTTLVDEETNGTFTKDPVFLQAISNCA